MEVRTALEGCEKHCKEFNIEQINLYMDGNIYKREFRCEHIDRCKALLEARNTYTVDEPTISYKGE